MFGLLKHPEAECPECGEPVLYGKKEEASGWKVYAMCDDRSHLDRRVGFVSMSDINHRDEAEQEAKEMVENHIDRL